MSATVVPSDSSDGEKHRSKYPPSRIAGLLPPWKPGVSPNPGGVKKGTVFISECYKRLSILSLAELQEFQPANAAEAMALRQIVAAIYGADALNSIKEITDRTEGKAHQSVELNSTTVNINVQVNLFLDAAKQLAENHGVPLELAQARMLAIAEPAQRAAIEAALVVAQATEQE